MIKYRLYYTTELFWDFDLKHKIFFSYLSNNAHDSKKRVINPAKVTFSILHVWPKRAKENGKMFSWRQINVLKSNKDNHL